MKRRKFEAAGVEVPVIGLGTWQMELDDRARAIAALRAGLDAGMLHVDTAEMYGSGEVEELVGEALQGRRDEVFLVSKVLPSNASRRGAVRACEQSLKRLGTEYLDCYLLHWPGDEPLRDTILAFEELRSAGKIRAWGVSNFDEQELAEAVNIAGPGKVSENQVLYHLGERTIEHAVLPFCEANGIAVVGYTPFGRATFPPKGGKGQVLEDIATKHGVTSRQVALAFLTRRPSLFAIPKSSNPDHVRVNAKAATLELDPEEIQAIDRAFPVGSRRSGVPML